ncbi:MAG TPA: hypothetical protein VIM58_12320 [Candidatus Methylacidiphilales bacterium]
MKTFFGNVLAAVLAFGVVVWLEWSDVETKIHGMADAYGAPAEVQRMPVETAPAAGATAAVPAPVAP